MTNEETNNPEQNVIHLDLHRPEFNRTITVLGEPWEVHMTRDLWEAHDLLKHFQGITENELAMHALEEMALQSVDFDTAYRGVVAYLINGLKEAYAE